MSVLVLRAINASIRHRPLLWFFALAYGWTWTDWIALGLADQRVNVGPVPSHFPGLFGPMVAAFVITTVVSGRSGTIDLAHRMLRWRVPVRWYVVALSPLVFGAIGLCVMVVRGESPPALSEFGRMGGAPTLHPLLLFLALIVLNGYAEEVGWRGFALPRLQERRGPLVASIILAVPWAIWHVPSFFILESYRDMNALMFVGFFFGIACGSIVLTWIYNATGSSIFMLALYHAGLNIMSGTIAARGTLAATVTTFVMINAVVLVVLELRARHGGRRGPLAPPRERNAGPQSVGSTAAPVLTRRISGV